MFMSQEHKKEIAAVIKPLLKKYGIKGTLSVHHHSTICLNIKSGVIDFISNFNEQAAKNYEGFNDFTPAKNHIQVNHYHVHRHFSGIARDFLTEAVKALHGPRFFDHSDMMTDYFHCSHYISVNVGKWNAPYDLVG